MTELEITPESLLDNLEMHRKLAQEAADEIGRIRAENEKLRAALVPFAYAAEDLDEDDKDNRSIWEHWVAGYIEIGHLRAAAAALKETGK